MLETTVGLAKIFIGLVDVLDAGTSLESPWPVSVLVSAGFGIRCTPLQFGALPWRAIY
jgi:hypothetical protein